MLFSYSADLPVARTFPPQSQNSLKRFAKSVSARITSGKIITLYLLKSDSKSITSNKYLPSSIIRHTPLPESSTFVICPVLKSPTYASGLIIAISATDSTLSSHSSFSSNSEYAEPIKSYVTISISPLGES